MGSERLLFQKPSLTDELAGRRKAFLSELDKMSQEQFDNSTDEQILQYMLARAELVPFALIEDDASLDFEHAQVDISKDSNRIFFERPSGPFYVAGRRAIISIPFTGSEWIFDYEPNPRYPHAQLRGTTESGLPDGRDGLVCLHVLVANDVPEERLLRDIEVQRDILRESVRYSGSQVTGFNNSLRPAFEQAIQDRRRRSSAHASIATKLNIPLRKRDAAPSIDPVPIVTKKFPTLGEAAADSGARKLGSESYEEILRLLRHQGRTYESTPSTYALHDEEGLRDIMLAQLNGHFEGGAAGEVFRKRGKTDIRIEFGDRSAFVAECKIWTGPATLHKAVDQLLGYLMWRDTKAAIVIFNKRTSMSRVLSGVQSTLSAHPNCLREISSGEQGEWRFQFRHGDDSDLQLQVHALAFDIKSH